MSEHINNPDPDIRLKEIQGHISTILGPVLFYNPDSTDGHQSKFELTRQDEILMQREYSVSELATALSNDEIADKVVDLLTDKCYYGKSANTFYAYWNVLKKFKANHEANVPKKFADLVIKLANEEGDPEAIFDVMMDLDEVEDIEIIEPKIPLTIDDVFNMSVRAYLDFLSVKEASYVSLDVLKSDEHRQDLELVVKHKNSSFFLLRDIKDGSIKTPEGIEAAKTYNDSALLENKYNNANWLERSLKEGHFLTEEGIRAATTRIDSLYINNCYKNIEDLINLVEDKLITTPEGVAMAYSRIDDLLLSEHCKSREEIVKLLENNRFKTLNGIAEAKFRLKFLADD